MLDVFSWFLPPHVRGDPAREMRYKGIVKSLLAISGVVTTLFFAYAAVRGGMSRIEAGLFAAAILTPALGAVSLRFLESITPVLVLTNVGGVAIVAVWSYYMGGIHSAALPWLLALFAVLSTFGSAPILVTVALVDVGAIVILYTATVNGWLPRSVAPVETEPTLMLLTMLSAVAMMVLAAILVLRQRERAKTLLRASRDAAEMASRAKTALLSSVSHELRTPLHAMIGFAELIKMSDQHALDPTLREHVEQIIRAGHDLNGLVAGLLEMSRIEAGGKPVAIEEIRVADLLAPALAGIAAEAGKRRIQVVDRCAAYSERLLQIDRGYAQRALQNLLSNAVKFNKESGQVTVSCEKPESGYLRLIVEDTGCGIPASQHAKLFEPFSRLNTDVGTIRGIGVGLAIAKRLVEAIGGKIGFRSTQGAGSSFWLDLPSAR